MTEHPIDSLILLASWQILRFHINHLYYGRLIAALTFCVDIVWENSRKFPFSASVTSEIPRYDNEVWSGKVIYDGILMLANWLR